MNIIGKPDYSKNFELMLSCLIGTSFDIVLSDLDDDYKCFVEEELNKLHSKGILQITKIRRFICKCGKVEMPVNVNYINQNPVRRVIVNGKCSLCKSELKEIETYCLVYVMPNPEFIVIPSSIDREVKELFNKLRGRGILVSREKRGVQLNIENLGFYLDVDFYWSMGFKYVSVKLYYGENGILVSSNRNLLATLLLSSHMPRQGSCIFISSLYIKSKRQEANPHKIYTLITAICN